VRYSIVLFLILLFLGHNYLSAQDVEKVIKAKPVKVSGGLSTDQVFYQAYGIADRRNSPYQYFINGNINVQLFEELSIPVSLSYSNQKFNYSQPFNQQQFNRFGISPKYRWITAHAGWRSMTFSPYSLNGHTFLGGGIELTPGKFKIAAMYGRLLKAVDYDSTKFGNLNKPSYQRMGMGVNFRYEDNGNLYGVSLFRSEDKPSSLKTSLDSLGVTPEQNLVAGVMIKQKMSSKVTFDGELSNSTITKDSRYKEQGGNEKNLGIIQTNSSTSSYMAYRAAFTYQLKKAKIGAGYERIDPGYRTHGAYYFNNDLENITVNFATPLFKNKVSIASNVGTQRNNLDKSKISTMRRWVGALNLNWKPNDKLNFGINYSNFQTYTNMRSQFQIINSTNPYQYIDTLNYIQISQSVNFNTNYIITSNQKQQQNFNLNLTAQKATEQQGGKTLNSGSNIYNLNASYLYSIVPLNLSFNVALNGNWNKISGTDSKIFGPTLGVVKSFFQKKLQSNLSYSWNTTLNNNTTTGSVGSLRWLNSVTIKKKHSIMVSFIWLNRQSKDAATGLKSFDELTGRVGYAFRF